MHCLNRLFLLMVAVCCYPLTACTNQENQTQIVSSHGLSVEVRKMPDDQANTETTFYSARLIPAKDTLTNSGLKTAIIYRMDSCFYLQRDGRKIFPKMVEPVANGVPGSFEYLLSFEEVSPQQGKWHLVYQDRYFNHYTYNLPPVQE